MQCKIEIGERYILKCYTVSLFLIEELQFTLLQIVEG